MSRARARRVFLLLLAVGALVAGPGPAARAADAPRASGFGDFNFTGSKAPIEIVSDKLDFDYEGRRATFRGSVEAKQRDIVLNAEELIITYSTEGEQQRIERVAAEGGVRITQGDRIATADRASFDQGRRILVLEGNAVLADGANRVEGEKVTVLPDEGKVTTSGAGKGRVKVEIFPDRLPSAMPAETPSPQEAP